LRDFFGDKKIELDGIDFLDGDDLELAEKVLGKLRFVVFKGNPPIYNRGDK